MQYTIWDCVVGGSVVDTASVVDSKVEDGKASVVVVVMVKVSVASEVGAGVPLVVPTAVSVVVETLMSHTQGGQWNST